MTKEEWQALNKRLLDLDQQLRNLYNNAYYFKYNKLKKADQEARERIVNTTKMLIRDKKEAYLLLMGDTPIGQASAEQFDEFGLEKYFQHNLHEFLVKIENKIKETL
ncbi:MAG: hypothetical protein JST90_01420 [Bacteroidetes bacterium]|nr:hypothetical protein [Bacteroidota bacterium]